MTQQERINKYIPKKYRDYVYEFYKDEDGWWIAITDDCGYWFDDCGYGTETIIHEDTLVEAVKEFKWWITPRPARDEV